MATIKSFTDLNQAKVLSKILPLESADMCYEVGEDLDGYITKTIYTPLMHTPYNDDYIPCWSLAALLDVLPDYTLQDNPNGTVFVVSEKEKPIMSDDYDNPIDACVAMVEKLHELKML